MTTDFLPYVTVITDFLVGMRYICDNGEQRNEPEYRIPDADAFRPHRNRPFFVLGVLDGVDPNLENVVQKGAERSQWEGGGKHRRKAKLNRQLDVV